MFSLEFIQALANEFEKEQAYAVADELLTYHEIRVKEIEQVRINRAGCTNELDDPAWMPEERLNEIKDWVLVNGFDLDVPDSIELLEEIDKMRESYRRLCSPPQKPKGE